MTENQAISKIMRLCKGWRRKRDEVEDREEYPEAHQYERERIRKIIRSIKGRKNADL